jgi:hypothetical protein
VFPLLTKYLLYYKRVSIPNIGSFIIEQQPAELNFVERLIQPPGYRVVFKNNEAVDEDLVTFIGFNTDNDVSTARTKLELFGRELKNKLKEAPFTWNGIGELEYTDSVVFHPREIKNPLQPVAANKVIKENAQHAVLVGEQEMQSGSMENVRTIAYDKKKRPVTAIIGFVLLLLSLLFLGYYFYTYRDTKSNTGLKTDIKPAAPAPTYK